MSTPTAGVAPPPAAQLGAWGAALYDAHPHAVLVVDATGRCLHANPAAEWLSGGGRARSLFDLLDLPDDTRVGEALRRALGDGGAWSGVVGARGSDGDVAAVRLCLLAAAAPAQAASASATARPCVIERESAESPLPGLLWTCDTELGLTWANQGLLGHAGRSLNALLGRGWVDLVHAEDRERLLGIFRASIEASLPFSLDLRLRRHDGEWRWMLLQAAPSGAGYGGVFVDIHERHRLETQLAEHTEARRRTDLRQGHFLASLSHELRGPLAPIANVASVLRTMETDSPTLLRLREILERQVARMRRVLDDLVDVTQALQGELSMVRQPVAVHEVMQVALSQVQRGVDAQGQQIALSLPSRPVTLAGDSVRLAQMLTSLLNNASRYSPEAATITVTAEVADEHLRIVVKDPGRGIAPAFLPRVFDLFAQEAREARGGLGMGLTLARRIAQAHGGEITAHSDGPGTGAEFVVSLPLESGSTKAAST